MDKPCISCGETFTCRRNNARRCKACKRKRATAWANAQRAKKPEAARVKARAFYKKHIEKHRALGREAAAARRKTEEGRAYQKAYRAANKERVAEKAREARRRRLETDAEKERERIRKNVEAWKARDPEKAALQKALDTQRRRARLGGIRSSISLDEWRERIALFSGNCAYCDAEALHMDHVIPLSRGGEDVILNVVPACAPCNLSKGNKLPLEWRPL
jgi:5-methylcytosine-specific restriction endonuclease McrA